MITLRSNISPQLYQEKIYDIELQNLYRYSLFLTGRDQLKAGTAAHFRNTINYIK